VLERKVIPKNGKELFFLILMGAEKKAIPCTVEICENVGTLLKKLIFPVNFVLKFFFVGNNYKFLL